MSFDIDLLGGAPVRVFAYELTDNYSITSELKGTTGSHYIEFTTPRENIFLGFMNPDYNGHSFYLDNVVITDLSPQATATFSERLNGSAYEKFGLAKSLSVMPGDVIKMEVYAKYVDPNSANWVGGLAGTFGAMVGQIASGSATYVIDGAAYTNSTASFPAGYMSYLTKTDNGAPKAYLNWLVFDRNFKPVDGGFKQITTAAVENGSDGNHEWVHPASDLVIKEPGLVYIWLSNEQASNQPVEVFFDDFKVEHIKSPVVQMDDYYPFGLGFNEYQRENSILNLYQYNGKEKQDELGLGWLDYGARMYVPEIGRFNRIDPIAGLYSRYSPYSYAIDNPIRYVDYLGLGPGDRVRKARSKGMIGVAYLQEQVSSLSTEDTAEALKYMDCAEYVCRVLAYDGITKGVKHMNTSALKGFFENNKFAKSQTPKVGDIALWDHHTGVVTEVDNNGKYKLSHARGTGKLSQENLYFATSSTYRSSKFYGFYHPQSEDEVPPSDISNVEPNTVVNNAEEEEDDSDENEQFGVIQISIPAKLPGAKSQIFIPKELPDSDSIIWIPTNQGQSKQKKKKVDADLEARKRSGGI